MSKYRKTIHLDIDGTILFQPGRTLTDIITSFEDTKVLDGAVELFNKWRDEGNYIILESARCPTLREHTLEQLRRVGLFCDQLILGITNGPRYIINNRKRDGLNTAYAINVEPNEGLKGITLEETNKNFVTDYKERCEQLEKVIAELYTPTNDECRLFSEHEQEVWSAGGSPPDYEEHKVQWALNRYGN
jgi:hypothetical protein